MSKQKVNNGDLLRQFLEARGRVMPPDTMNTYQAMELMFREILLLHTKVEQLENQLAKTISNAQVRNSDIFPQNPNH